MAIYQVLISGITAPTTPTSIDMVKMQLLGTFRSRVYGNPNYRQESEVFKAIKDITDITDNRINYY